MTERTNVKNHPKQCKLCKKGVGYEQGLSQREVAKKYDVGKSSVGRHRDYLDTFYVTGSIASGEIAEKSTQGLIGSISVDNVNPALVIDEKSVEADDDTSIDDLIRAQGDDPSQVEISSKEVKSRELPDGKVLTSTRVLYKPSVGRSEESLDITSLFARTESARPSARPTGSEDRALVVVWADSQTGKALDDSTPMLTPSGWTTHGALVPGDYVYGVDGLPKKILATTGSTDQELFKVVFDRDVEIIASGDHLWQGIRKMHPSGYKTGNLPAWEEKDVLLSTREIAALPTRLNTSGTTTFNRTVSVPLPSALSMPEKPLPIDPYLFGLWLGDGHSGSGRIGLDSRDGEYLDTIGKKIPSMEKSGMSTWTIPGLRTGLRKLGVLKNKHVPVQYLYSSAEQRLALLQGLMDTDGSCDEKGYAEFSNTNASIVEAVKWILTSLGFKYTERFRIGKFNGKEYKPYSRINFATNPDTPVFRFTRKLDRCRSVNGQEWMRYRQIQRIEPVGTRSAQCITVEGSLYLAGEDLVVTHNCDRNGGTAELIARVKEKQEALREFAQYVNASSAFLLDAGDGVEGFENTGQQQFTNDLSLMEQVDLEATFELETAIILADLHQSVTVSGIPSNHCAWRSGKNSLGKPSDDWGIFIKKQLKKAFELNPETYGHVNITLPNEWEEMMTVDVLGHGMGLVHGHQVSKPEQMRDWWGKQLQGGNLWDAEVLIHGHWHHLRVEQDGRHPKTKNQKYVIGAPALDNGSAWIGNSSGIDSDPGLLAFVVEKGKGFLFNSMVVL